MAAPSRQAQIPGDNNRRTAFSEDKGGGEVTEEGISVVVKCVGSVKDISEKGKVTDTNVASIWHPSGGKGDDAGKEVHYV